MENIFELLIVGAGPAGLSAAIYSARKKISLALVTTKLGGQLLGSSSVENYLGIDDDTGIDISKKFHEHFKRYKKDISIYYDETVVSIVKDGDIFEIKTKGRFFKAQNVLIASGRTSQKLNVDGEERFSGKGVVYCATCDAPVFSGEDVVVAGGGNSALDAVLQLTEYANKIYLVDEEYMLRADEIQVDKALKSGKVEIFNNSKITKLQGENFLSSVTIDSEGESREVSVGGLFVEIGSVSNSTMVDGLVGKDESGDIIIDSMCRTNVEGIFAAGDVSNVFGKQAIISAGEGAKASLAVYERLKEA